VSINIIDAIAGICLIDLCYIFVVEIKLLGWCNVITYEMTYCACVDLISVVPEMSRRG
jgi:hypothetical protein